MLFYFCFSDYICLLLLKKIVFYCLLLDYCQSVVVFLPIYFLDFIYMQLFVRCCSSAVVNLLQLFYWLVFHCLSTSADLLMLGSRCLCVTVSAATCLLLLTYCTCLPPACLFTYFMFVYLYCQLAIQCVTSVNSFEKHSRFLDTLSR